MWVGGRVNGILAVFAGRAGHLAAGHITVLATAAAIASTLEINGLLAAQVVNALANAYIEQNYKTKFDSTVRVSDWLSKQLADLQIKVETSQEKLVRYQKEKGILGIDEKQNIITSKLDELNRDLTAAQTDRIQKEANYRLAIADVARSESGTLLERLRTQQAELESQIAQVTAQFGPAYPKVRELRNQWEQVKVAIKQESTDLGRRFRNEYLAAVQREKMLSAALEEQKQEANKL